MSFFGLIRIRVTSLGVAGLRVRCRPGSPGAAKFQAQDTVTPAGDSNILHDRLFHPTNGQGWHAHTVPVTAVNKTFSGMGLK